jgi:hypothetical protein
LHGAHFITFTLLGVVAASQTWPHTPNLSTELRGKDPVNLYAFSVNPHDYYLFIQYRNFFFVTIIRE